MFFLNLTFGLYLVFNRQYTYRLFSHALLGHLLSSRDFRNRARKPIGG